MKTGSAQCHCAVPTCSSDRQRHLAHASIESTWAIPWPPTDHMAFFSRVVRQVKTCGWNLRTGSRSRGLGDGTSTSCFLTSTTCSMERNATVTRHRTGPSTVHHDVPAWNARANVTWDASCRPVTLHRSAHVASFFYHFISLLSSLVCLFVCLFVCWIQQP